MFPHHTSVFFYHPHHQQTQPTCSLPTLKMKLTTLLTTAPLALLTTLTTAAPAPAPAPAAIEARHSTSARFSKFTATCTSTSCSYAATLTLLPENITVNFSHTTSGSTIPANSGHWTSSSDPLVFLRWNKTPFNEYRIVVSDVHVVGTSVILDFFSPAADWVAQPNPTSYVGSQTFEAV
ncbi:uncharacterized protein PODANS_1_175 [Podospora anserina S mat+]|uniref:Podospora anserina S mat+ genomic DNA chromosome 1, supercontig 1 n=2 Tax=Podospora TaxID=5144 RepID=B2A9J4_PODAN|nr:uncharacterized protein PODANS_1_175 [Podospora anserina S mat+]KAK4646954.1 hypothetical protein QC761_100175 [Podospora bellae-mahoneyi]CAP59741.1 unnamed protein product [Podospora anserina S mat+]CDP22384.1 Putative protein of unknown function [Podospora anserina S mat+]